jgi:hypothetical protein
VEKLKSSQVLLVIIGRDWERRLNDSKDFVRLEIETALANNLIIVPILLDGRAMPNEEALPNSIRSILRRNAITIHPDSYENAVYRLISQFGEEWTQAKTIRFFLRVKLYLSNDCASLRDA